jgi:uncharacterized protein YggE
MQRPAVSGIIGILCSVVFGVMAFPLPSHSDTITATGIGIIPAANPELSSIPVVVYAGVEADGPDADNAITQVNAKVQVVKSALEKAGVDASSFVVLNFYVYPRPGTPDPSSSAPSVEYEAALSFQVTASGLNQVGVLLNAAIAAGATNVSTYLATRSSGSQPSSNEVAEAVADAMDQAKIIATAAAASAGVSLGRLLSVDIRTLQVGSGPTVLVGADLAGRSLTGAGGWGVEVTNAYEALP